MVSDTAYGPRAPVGADGDAASLADRIEWNSYNPPDLVAEAGSHAVAGLAPPRSLDLAEALAESVLAPRDPTLDVAGGEVIVLVDEPFLRDISGAHSHMPGLTSVGGSGDGRHDQRQPRPLEPAADWPVR